MLTQGANAEGPPAYNPRSMRNSSSNQEMIHFQLSAISIISLFLDFLNIYSFSNCDSSFIGPGIELLSGTMTINQALISNHMITLCAGQLGIRDINVNET